MAVTISIKNVPDELAEQLRTRAKRHHRSIQGEVMSILEEAGGKSSGVWLDEFLEATKHLPRFTTASDSTELIRK